MKVTWKCDSCGKECHVNPPTQVVTEKKKIDGKDVDVPVLTKMKRQNDFSGEIEEVSVPKVIDLAPRAHIIRLVAGNESISKDVCSQCLDKIRPEMQGLWNKLASFKSQ